MHFCLLLLCIRLKADCFLFESFGHFGRQTLHQACRKSKNSATRLRRTGAGLVTVTNQS
ncbi:uncharacterized protein AruCF_0830 [Achromobacter ruhlandii]|nr:uncharacterized protein AruCF_0830 [Achromobacter ruhlandii]